MIAIVGCGTLGSRLAELLQDHDLLLVDHDTVHQTNIASQKFSEKEIGLFKSEALAKRLGGKAVHEFIDITNTSLLSEAEIVCDCTDNLFTRKALNRWCLENGVPLVHAAAGKERGAAAIFHGKPCLECVYGGKIPVEACRGSDIDAALADTLSVVQARLAEEALAGNSPGKEFIFVRSDKEHAVSMSRESCAVCAKRPVPPIKDTHYLTWCPKEQCFALRPVKGRASRLQNVAINELPALQSDSELRFEQNEKIEYIERALSGSSLSK
jgi:molybdopterin-synthase adenylyltransferase